MSDRETKKLQIPITGGEMKLLNKLSIFTKCDLFTKNKQMLVRKNRYRSTRPNSTDCVLEEPQADDKGDQVFCGDRASLRNTEASSLTLCSLIKKSPTLTGLEPRSVMMKMIETNEEELSAMESDPTSTKVEERFTLRMLDNLKTEFKARSEHEIGLKDFKVILKQNCSEIFTKERDMETFFQRIDCFSDGFITLDALCSYMQLICSKSFYIKDKEKEMFFKLPAKCVTSPHREDVLRAVQLWKDPVQQCLSESFACCSKDGVLSFWSMAGPKLKKSKCLVPPNTLKQKWVTDFAVMFEFYKIIISTGDRELQFYDSFSLEACCQISGFSSIPLQIDYCYMGADSCIISFGDLEGCVSILILTTVRDSLSSWKRGVKDSGIPTVSIGKVVTPPYVRFCRWKAHQDWVQQVRYSPELRQLISCSANEKTALVIGCIEDKSQTDQTPKQDSIKSQRIRSTSVKGASSDLLDPKIRPRSDETAFSICKGVKCFDTSRIRNYIVTAGLDRNVRIWNPYMPGKPISILKAHEAPVIYIYVSDEEEKVFTISLDKCIFVWDLLNHCSLLSCRPRSHRIPGSIQACHYFQGSRSLLIISETLNLIQQKNISVPARKTDGILSHGGPIQAMIYNHLCKQLITASESSMIKIWDIHRGSKLFQFDASRDGHSITCMLLDDTCRRLFTGGSEGSIHIWNYNNGELLKTLSPGPKTMCEIIDMAYVVSNDRKYLVSVGWSKQITIYPDDRAEFKQNMLPFTHWPDDLAKGHEEDIVSVTFCPCNLLVTSSRDGLIMVWNFVSGHRICSLMTPEDGPAFEKKGQPCTIEGRITNQRNNFDRDCDDGSEYIDYEIAEMTPQVLLLTTRCNKPLVGNLVSLGTKGCIHFWNVHKSGGSHFTSQYIMSNCKEASVVVMTTDSANQILVLGDNQGFVYLWDITEFCIEQTSHSPTFLTKWRAHVHELTSLHLVEESRSFFIIASSTNGHIRIFNDSGHFIGTFSAKEHWILSKPSTYIHPRVPFDVLIHPLSLPTHSLIANQHLTTEQIIFSEDYDNNDEVELEAGVNRRYESLNLTTKQICTKSKSHVKSPSNKRSATITDKCVLVEEILNTETFLNATGPRLRYERTKPCPPKASGPFTYAHLKVHDLKLEPSLES